MGAMVIGIGIAVILVGIAAGFNGLAIYQSSFGNALVIVAGFGFVGGLLLVALGLVLRALVRIEDRLAGAVHFEPEEQDYLSVVETVAEDAAPSEHPAIVPEPVARPTAPVVAGAAVAATLARPATGGPDPSTSKAGDEAFRIDTDRFADALMPPEPRIGELRSPASHDADANRMPDLRSQPAPQQRPGPVVAASPSTPAPDLSRMRAPAAPPVSAEPAVRDEPPAPEGAGDAAPGGLPGWFRRREPAAAAPPVSSPFEPASLTPEAERAAPEVRNPPPSAPAVEDEEENPFRQIRPAPPEEVSPFLGLSRPAPTEDDEPAVAEHRSESAAMGGEGAEDRAGNPTEDGPAGGGEAQDAQLEEAQPAILKSGIIAGMAYTLYADGSIEAELPDGVIRFGSIQELRDHVSGATQRQG